MRAVQFSEQDVAGEILTVEFGEDSVKSYVVGTIAHLLRSLREWIIADKDIEMADKIEVLLIPN